MTKTDSPPLPRLAHTVAEVAEAIGISEREVYRLLDAGELPEKRVGRRRLIRRADLETWLAKDVAS